MIRFPEIKYHFIILLLFSLIFFGIFQIIPSNKTINQDYQKNSILFKKLNLDINSYEDRIIFQESRADFFNRTNISDELPAEIETIYSQNLEIQKNELYSNLENDELVSTIIFALMRFIFLFTILSILIFYLSKTLALQKILFLTEKHYFSLENITWQIEKFRQFPTSSKVKRNAQLFFKLLLKLITLVVLFSPVYVIGYSINLKGEQISIVMAVFLGLISNGLLITSTNSFYQFLQSESKKGYVKTAKLKNLKNMFENDENLNWKKLFALKKVFPNNTLNQIYINADLHFTTNFKNFSRLIITSLVIIELTLNIQSGFFYLMLKSVLFGNYKILAIVIYLTFLVVKLSDIVIEFISIRKNMKYEN